MKPNNSIISNKLNISLVKISLQLMFIINMISIVTCFKAEKLLLVIQVLIISCNILLNFKKLFTKYFWVAVGIFYSLLISIINGSGLGAFIAFYIIIISSLLGKEITFTKKQTNSINITFLICVLLILVVYSVPVQHYRLYFFKNIFVDYKLNPNTYGMFTLALGLCMLVFINDNLKNNFLRLFINLFVFCLISYILYNTKSRTSLFAYFLFCFLIFIYDFIHNYKTEINQNKLNKILIITAIGISLLILFLYTYMYKIIGDKKIIILGKNLFSGRQKIWDEAIKTYFDNILIGFSNKTKFYGYFLHNAFLTVLCNLTFIGLISIIYGLYNNVINYNNQTCNEYMIFAIIAFIFVSTFENMFMSNKTTFLLMPFLFNKKNKIKIGPYNE